MALDSREVNKFIKDKLRARMIPGTTPVLGLVSAALSGTFASLPCILHSFNLNITNKVEIQAKNNKFPVGLVKLMTKQSILLPQDVGKGRVMIISCAASL